MWTATYPCDECGSPNHSTQGHPKLESAYKRWGIGLKASGPQGELEVDDRGGITGAPSPLTNALVMPDHLRIVPCTISATGMQSITVAAVLRLWRKDPEGAHTFTLSWAPDAGQVIDRLARICGEPGSRVSVEIGSRLTILKGEPAGT